MRPLSLPLRAILTTSQTEHILNPVPHTPDVATPEMSNHSDLAVYNRHRRLTAAVEVKNKLGTTREWAARTRRNILAHGPSIDADFFLLVTPDRLYVWTGSDSSSTPTLPTHAIDTHTHFQPYFQRAHVDPTRVSGHAFELIVSSWLSELTRNGESTNHADEPAWLTQSGLRNALSGGRVEHQALA